MHSLVVEYARTFGIFHNEMADRWQLSYSALIFAVFQLIATFEHDPIPAASVSSYHVLPIP
jgi:hypothetical protein